MIFLIGIDEHMVNNILTAYLKRLKYISLYLKMILISVENMIKLIHLIFECSFHLNLMLIHKANLIAITILTSIIWLKFNKYLNRQANTFNLS
jgi:hypothetical protein